MEIDLKVIIITEGGHKQGMGHVYRQITLAKELCKFSDVLFFTNNSDIVKRLIRKNGFKASTTQKSIRSFNPDVVIFDKQNIEKEFVSKIRKRKVLVVTFDDTTHLGDISFNALYYAKRKTGVYQGYEYPILEALKPIDIKKKVQNVLITQGGSDTYGFTAKILKAINGKFNEITFFVVMGPAFKHNILPPNNNFKILKNVTDMYALMRKTDIAITAGGMTLYELTSLGIPSIVVCGEHFEEETAKRFSNKGIAINLGFGRDVSDEQITQSLERLITSYELRKKMSLRGIKTIDRKGVKRIVQIIKSKWKNVRYAEN